MLWNDPKHRGPVKRGPTIAYNGGHRRTQPRLIVIHDAEGSTAAGVASYGASGQRNASWHATVDEKEVITQLADDVIAWAAPGANMDGLQLELAGFARWSKLEWYRHQATLKRAAWHTARWCVKHGIPPRWLSTAQLRDGFSEGITTHVDVNRAFRGSDHTDPGPGFPRAYFLFLVKRRVKWLQTGR